jgi:hypothetical protein
MSRRHNVLSFQEQFTLPFVKVLGLVTFCYRSGNFLLVKKTQTFELNWQNLSWVPWHLSRISRPFNTSVTVQYIGQNVGGNFLLVKKTQTFELNWQNLSWVPWHLSRISRPFNTSVTVQYIGQNVYRKQIQMYMYCKVKWLKYNFEVICKI